jgi:hypothetical protein
MTPQRTRPIEELDVLATFARLVADRSLPSGFHVLSPFAERHGAWELRLIRQHDLATHLISIATATPAAKVLRFELWAGVSIPSQVDEAFTLSDRVRIASLSVKAFDKLDPHFDDALMRATYATTDMEGRLILERQTASRSQETAFA